MNVGDVRWLAGPAGQALLRSLPAYDESEVIALLEQLRSEGLHPALAAAAATQLRLRARAQEKFGEFAEGMLFTADGLEQATRFDVAAGHAQRFAQASLATVHDLGCGIGADAMALATLGVTVAAVDRDPVVAAVADANLRPWPDCRARTGEAEDFAPPADPSRARVGVWLDPARRVSGVADVNGRARRLFRLEDISPSWSFVQALAERVPAVGVKLSPSFPHDHIPRGAEAQWVSRANELLECCIWWGPLVRTSGRTARIIRPGKPAIELTEDQGTAEVPALRLLRQLSPWLYEADRAVLQAGLVGVVTAATSGHELEPGLGLVSSSRGVDLPFARRYRVREAMPLNHKRLRVWLRENGITGLTVKKRGVRLDEDHLRRQLRVGRTAGSGDTAILILTRLAGQQVAIVADRA